MAYTNNNALSDRRWMLPAGSSPAALPNNHHSPNELYYYNAFPSYYHNVQNGNVDDPGRNLENGYRMQNYAAQNGDYPPFLGGGLQPPHHSIGSGMPNAEMPVYVQYPMNVASSNRMQRNLAEKMRRDKLNSYINELAVVVPMVSRSSKRMDKTSVLRLSATYLRMHTLDTITREQQFQLPQFFKSIDFSQLLLDEMDGNMIIVTSVGKIIFITYEIEKVLGHTQVELLGQSLFNITAPEDHAELKKCLSPDESEECTSSEGTSETEEFKVTSSEPMRSPSCSTRSLNTSRCFNKPSTSSSSSQFTNENGSTVEKQRRSFYLRLRHRCMARSEQPQYELVHLFGYLSVPKKLASQAQKKSRKQKVEVTVNNSNEVFLVAVVKPFSERRVTELSLIEPSRDEYITRHTIDGRIVYSDHRISVVAGYLSEEVAGMQAFSFMHKEDVHWVIIALQQMFCQGESYGLSCYRLKTKTGQFIYLKSHGYLEFNLNTETYASFICVNSLVSEDEGLREISQMKKKYTPLIEPKNDCTALSPIGMQLDVRAPSILDGTEDPKQLETAIKAMVSRIPKLEAGSVRDDPQKSEDPPYVKAKLVSKTLPPLNKQIEGIKTFTGDVVPNTPPSSVPTLSSPQSSTSATGVALSPPLPSRTPQSRPSKTPQNRPSVLRIAPSSRPITIYNDVDNCVITSTSSGSACSEKDAECVKNGAADFVAKYDYASSESEYAKQSNVKVECIKQETPEDENFERIRTLEANDRTRVVPASPAAVERTGVVVRRNAAKRPYDADEKSFYLVPSKRGVVSPLANEPTQQCHRHVGGAHPVSPSPHVFDDHLSFPNLANGDDEITDCLPMEDLADLPAMDVCDPTVTLAGIDAFQSRPTSEITQLLADADLKYSHIKLESRIHMQGEQINAIRSDLGPFATEPFWNEKNLCLNQLNEDHIKQSRLLKTLQLDHHSLGLQRCGSDGVN